MSINPYSGYDNDPFEIDRLCHFGGVAFSVFKKLSCAGIAGRMKEKDKDLREAVFSLNRLITDIEDGKRWAWSHPDILICEVMAEYRRDLPDWQRRALFLFLECHYKNYENLNQLRDCIALIEERICEPVRG